MLLSVAVEKLNLEFCPIKVKNVLAGKRPVCGEVDLARLRLLARVQIVSDHDFTYAVKAVNPYFSSVKDHPVSILIDEDFGGEDVLAEVVKVNPLSKLAVTSPCLLRSGVQVLHLGIVWSLMIRSKPMLSRPCRNGPLAKKESTTTCLQIERNRLASLLRAFRYMANKPFDSVSAFRCLGLGPRFLRRLIV